MVDEVVSKMGHIDVMVANAGIAAVKELRHQTGEDLKRMIDVNVGTFVLFPVNLPLTRCSSFMASSTA